MDSHDPRPQLGGLAVVLLYVLLEEQKLIKTQTMGKKILITGASGFIGGFLVDEALKRGYDVWAGVRAHSSRTHLSDPRIHFIDLSYQDPEKLTEQLKEFQDANGSFDYVIHNAGLTKTNDPKQFFVVNAENTHRLIEALADSDCSVKKFALMSSLSGFGKGDEKTFRPIMLTDEQRPDTAYGRSKVEAERYLKEQKHFPYIILRPTGVYGPGEKDYFMEVKMIAAGFDFAVGSTPQRITFIYVRDLAAAVFLLLENETVMNRAFFVADGDVWTDSQYARLIQKILGKKHVLHARIPLPLVKTACAVSETIGKWLHKSMTLNNDKYHILSQRNWICDLTELHSLGFKAQYPLERGLRESIDWYKQHGWMK